MSDFAILHSDRLEDLLFVRERFNKHVRYSSDFGTLSRVVRKFGSQTVIARSSCLSTEAKSLMSKHFCRAYEYSSFQGLGSLLNGVCAGFGGGSRNERTSVPAESKRPAILGCETAAPESYKSLCALSPTFARLKGSSLAMQKLRRDIARIARFNISVLLLGETGSGKTTVARAIHELSARQNKPFKTEVLSNTNESLIEARLFGVSAGGFTGAVEGAGVFEETSGGTLFLDEIGEVSPNIQTKLLQVLSEGMIHRVGSNKDIHVDNRMIFATNANLAAKIKLGSFREDLFYRINDVTLRIPPLRERIEDIPELAEDILHRAGIKKRLSPSALALLQTFSWRGNIRQLEKCVRNAALLYCDGDIIEPQHIQL